MASPFKSSIPPSPPENSNYSDPGSMHGLDMPRPEDFGDGTSLALLTADPLPDVELIIIRGVESFASHKKLLRQWPRWADCLYYYPDTCVLYDVDRDCASLAVISWLYTQQIDPKLCYPLGFFGACVAVYDSNEYDEYRFDIPRHIRYTIEEGLKSYHIDQEGKEADIEEVIVKATRLPSATREAILRPHVNEYVTRLIQRYNAGLIRGDFPFSAAFELINDMINWQCDSIGGQDVRNVPELMNVLASQTTRGPQGCPRFPFSDAFHFMRSMIESQGEQNAAQNARIVLQLMSVFASQTPSHSINQEREGGHPEREDVYDAVDRATEGVSGMIIDED